jgi:hypothetical protein
MRARRLVSLGGAVVLALALGGCGRAESGPLADTDSAMAKLDAGRIDLAVMATTADDPHSENPVGFRMEGPFNYEGDRQFPELDLRYTSLLGGRQQAVRIVSDGRTVEVVQDSGARTPVPAQQAGLLRLGKGDGGVADLGVGGWVQDAAVVERPDGTRLVTGRVDVADLLSDLARINAQAAGTEAGKSLDGDRARRLDRLARKSQFTAELDRDHLPRRLRAILDFGPELPADLRAALGPYASPRLEVSLTVEPAEH